MLRCEYIWLDGTKPTAMIRGKTKFVNSLSDMKKDWVFDGSSTGQAVGNSSDCILKPVTRYKDQRYTTGYIFLCEVYNVDGTPHNSNTRSALTSLSKKEVVVSSIPRVGFEQEYFIMREGDGRPLGFPYGEAMPREQGPYYCSVGGNNAHGRGLVDSHAEECLHAEISICGINAEVAPGQWEYQIGGTSVGVIKACDDLIVSRYLLMRQTESGYYISFDQKPIAGDWNGSGMHTNFSTLNMREPNGIESINKGCELLGEQIDRHLAVYGADYKSRLTGKHETAGYEEFTYGISDRGASVRIPCNVAKDRCGYLEDRRPGANADPYAIMTAMITTIILEE